MPSRPEPGGAAAVTRAVAIVALATIPVARAYPQATALVWQPRASGTHASFRGLSVARDGTIWVGGTQGTVIRSTDGGATWTPGPVAEAAAFDFRGVAGIDSVTAFAAVSSADTARIYRTDDGGHSWRLQFRDERHGVFLDGIACWDDRRCLAAGDPIAGHFLIVTTNDGGQHWTEHDTATTPSAMPGEAAFAASNSTVLAGSDGRTWVATGGGPVGRVWRSSDYGRTWHVTVTPVTAGVASAGIFSVAFCGDQRGMVVGGNYRSPDSTGAHVATTTDGGATWTPADQAHATAYLSGVACVTNGSADPAFVAVGPSGTFASFDRMNWHRTAGPGFNAVAVVRDALVAVGADGSVATGTLARRK